MKALFILSLILLFQGYFCKNLLDPNNHHNYKTLKEIKQLEDFHLKNINRDDDDPNLKYVSFLLYTYANKDYPLKFDIDTDPQILINYGFDKNKMTKFVAHGWVVDGEDFALEFSKGLFLLQKFLLYFIPNDYFFYSILLGESYVTSRVIFSL